MGFQDIYNENNLDFWGTGNTESNLYEYTYTPANNLQIDFNQTKLFIPTGTKEIEVTVNAGPNVQKIGSVAKLKTQPGANILHYPYTRIPWETLKPSDTILKRFEEGDVYTNGIRGVVPVLPYTVFSKPLHDSFAGWLYLKLLRFDLGGVVNIKYKLKVDKSFYTDWINRVVWDEDNNPSLSYPPVGFKEPPSVSTLTSTKLIDDDLYPNVVKKTIAPNDVQRYYFPVTDFYLKAKISVLSETLGSLYHLNISTDRFLNNDEVQYIKSNNLGALDPVGVLPNGVSDDDILYLTVVNLQNAEAKYFLYVELT